jgi:hypothetical protein
METKKLFGVLILVVGSVAGCATSAAVRAVRGTVLSTSPGNRAIVRGPTTMHVYAAFAGGELYNAPAETGTDADCARVEPGGSVISLWPDRLIHVAVPAGQMACLRTRVGSGYELLWHAVGRPPLGELLASAINGRPRNDVPRH